MLYVDYCFVQKVTSRCINTFGHGGGTIKRRSTCALLLVLGIAVSIFPSIAGATDQSASDDNANIGLSEHKDVLKVNAATKVKVWYKKWYKKHGKWRYVWRYYWKYKSTKTVKAASTTTKSSYTSSGTADTYSDPKLNSIMKSAAGYGYRSGVSTATGLVKYGAGDCWAYSEYLNSKFKAAGYQSRIIQYATAYSSRHRSVQLYQNGQWKTVPYRAYGYNYLIV